MSREASEGQGSGRLRVGVVGFSRPHFDEDEARRELQRLLDVVRARHPGAALEIVSGLTNQGVPRIAYALAAELGLRTVGVSARQALRVRAGVYPVDERILVGERFGDESAAFVASIDVLLRIGGGPQSRREVALFRARFGGDEAALDGRLLEVEVAWHEPPPRKRRA